MRRLDVYYDARCAFCIRCARWLSTQPQLVPLRLVAVGVDRVPPEVDALLDGGCDELITVADDGAVYRGADALLMCLYALRHYRRWSMRLASPMLKPLVRRFFGRVSHHRHHIAAVVGLGGANADLRKTLSASPEPSRCERGACIDAGRRVRDRPA